MRDEARGFELVFVLPRFFEEPLEPFELFEPFDVDLFELALERAECIDLLLVREAERDFVLLSRLGPRPRIFWANGFLLFCREG